MKLALSVHKDCISTVFDAADQLLMIETDMDGLSKKTNFRMPVGDPLQRAAELKARKVDVLICGAISRLQERAIATSGITVYSFVRGPVQDVIEGYENGLLHEPSFILPGCQGRGMNAGMGRGRRRGCPWRPK